MKELIAKVKNKYSNRVTESLIKKLDDEVNLPANEKVKIVNQLAYWVYIFNDADLSLMISKTISETPFSTDYDIWTWVRSILILQARIFREKGDVTSSTSCVTRIRDSFNIGDELKVKQQKKALERRLNGALLYYEKIVAAQTRKDLESEIDWRFVHFCELCFISEMGGSESYPKSRVENEIEENRKVLASNPIVVY